MPIAAPWCSIPTASDCMSNARSRIWKQILGGTIELQTVTMDIADYLTQGGQTAGHRELWRLLRSLFDERGDPASED